MRCPNDIVDDPRDGCGIEAYGESDGYSVGSRAAAGLDNCERDWKLYRPQRVYVPFSLLAKAAP